MDEALVIRQWSARNWQIFLKVHELVIKKVKEEISIPLDGSRAFKVKWRWFRWVLLLDGKFVLKLSGLRRSEAKFIALSDEISQVRMWSESLELILLTHREQQRWISQETIDFIINSRPKIYLRKKVHRLGILGKLRETEIRALDNLEIDLEKLFERLNQEFLIRELSNQSDFLDNIESSPLSLEQSKAVITFDNRVLLVAAAGSGKTSVMVARAAYATKKGFVDPSKILLLAFNTSAAEELKNRINQRFESASIDSSGIRASTFHAFGLDVLGRALDARPKVAPWVKRGADIEEISLIVKELKNSSIDFKYKWDLYRLIFTPEVLRHDPIEPDTWDRDSKKRGFRTFDGNLVRSHGERMVANWLYLHGTNYEYEADYKIRTADIFHRQYTPDFYYPDIDTWHEHWALDLDGLPPKEFSNYLEDMSWKRNLHKQNKTELIETTYGQVVYSDGLAQLKSKLLGFGLEMNWDPDRPKAEFTNIEESSLIRLVRSFMQHVKSNSLSDFDLKERLAGEWQYLKSERTDIFLDLYWPIHQEWDRRLSSAGAIDFEDMLVMAAKKIEDKSYTPDVDLILVDEFQDSSTARGRLVRSLLQSKGKYILAVGDDWQSINRFAGADISLMTNFNTLFGAGPTLQLTKTFRCTQAIADVATNFVTKNPLQIKKTVEAERAGLDHPVILICSNVARSGVRDALERISKDVEVNSKATSSVYILGRYNHDREEWLPNENFSNLKISFKTIHGAKGLEADYVIIVNLERGKYGFPSEIEDDPVLSLAMSVPENFEHAEERRLLYVALTRAKKQTFLITRQNMDSAFAVELIKDRLLDVINVNNDENDISEVKICNKCNKGVLIIRSGRFGRFFGCSRFPQCMNTINIK